MIQRNQFLFSARVNQSVIVSATRGDNLSMLVDRLESEIAEGPQFYPDHQVTDTRMRELAGDLVRESALHYLDKEVPHGVHVVIEEFDDLDGERANISAIIVVEQERHKRIVIGKGGSMVKMIGTRARREIASMLGGEVFLSTHVKVLKDWRNDRGKLSSMGY